MKRVLILGSGGAGKTTLAKVLATIHQLPIVHLDSLYWQSGWIETPREQWQETVSDLVQGEAWVMDGNYSGTLDARMAACDTVIFLDLSRWICLWRVCARLMTFYGRTRPDMAAGCPERLSWEFISWIWRYPDHGRAIVTAKLAEHAAGKQVVILRSCREVDEFIVRQRELAAPLTT